MESMNYTYEDQWIGGGQYFLILNKNGAEIARAYSEESAALIISALNGVAV